MGKRGPKEGKGGRPTLRARAAAHPQQSRLTAFMPRATERRQEPERNEEADKAPGEKHTTSIKNDNADGGNDNYGNVNNDAEDEGGDNYGHDDEDEDNIGHNDDEDNEAHAVKKEYWPPVTIEYFDSLKREVDKSVKFRKGKPIQGQFPIHLHGKIAPQDDPVGFFSQKHLLQVEDFCLPDTVIFYPEAQWPLFYPHGRPKCKWHNCTDCVVSYGWVKSPRHCYDLPRGTALLGKAYFCTQRRLAKERPFHFRGYDAKVLEGAPDYVREWWKKNGFYLSHRAAVGISVIENLRSYMNQGLSASGFLSSFIEELKRQHLHSARMWRDYINQRAKQPPPTIMAAVMEARRVDFVDFLSLEYDGKIPSLAYLLEWVVRRMEYALPYNDRRMMMIDGQHLSGDHSFKLVKMIKTKNGKVFTAMYTIMNEYCQVAAWWFTTGTSLTEIKNEVEKLKQRYELYGFEGPNSFSTDRCCQERQFWSDNLLRWEDDDAETMLAPEDLVTKEVVGLPQQTRVRFATTAEVAVACAGEISDYLIQAGREHKYLVVDCEWDLGRAKADVLGICTPENKIFLFHLAVIKRIPGPLKTLLEMPNIRKIGNRIHNDVKKMKSWQVDLAPTEELGHLSHARCLTGRAPSLAFLISLLFHGVELEGKDDEIGSGPRTGFGWSRGGLSTEKQIYASKDLYATHCCYQKIMSIMDPKVEARLRPEDVKTGRPIILYARGWKMRVCEAIILGAGDNPTDVRCFIDVANSDKQVFATGTLIQQEDGRQCTLKSLLDAARAEEKETIEFQWPLFFVRRLRQVSSDPIELVTEQRKVPREDGASDNEELFQHNGYSADREDDESESSDSDGHGDTRQSLPRSRRHRLYRYRLERTKQDLLHVFQRFERSLHKTHGAYDEFRIALRDALLVVNPEDLTQCKDVMKHKKMTDGDIEKRLNENFGWFLKRCRRTVPPPPELLERYLKVYTAFHDVKDATTGKALFASEKAKKVHKSLVKHIRRNCISDIPFVSYYISVGQDSDGLTLYRCIRGTSALEGLHQKLRQLVRGFSNSPRLVRALVSDFLGRWNHKIEVKLRQLDSKYEYMYDGDSLEEEIEKMLQIAGRDTPPHASWRSTRDFQGTDEVFGIIGGKPPERHGMAIGEISNEDIDTELDEMTQAAVDTLLEEETGVGDHEEKYHLPASSKWLADQHSRKRPTGRVRGSEEWKYFKEHYASFQGAASTDEADNYSTINFSAFAKSWNSNLDKMIDEKVATEMTYKTAANLKDAFKIYKQRSNRNVTMLPVTENISTLRADLRDATAFEFDEDTFLPPHRIQPPPRITTTQSEQRETSSQTDMTIPFLSEISSDAVVDTVVASTPTRKRKERRGNYRKSRCRTCGHEYSTHQWKPFHQIPETSSTAGYRFVGMKNLQNQKGLEPFRYCTVPTEERAAGFPVAEGKEMPRRDRTKKAKESSETD